ncbi:MAG: DNA-binding protein [Pseudoflavonifractor sp.]|nr:DNA-binding protein [Pseudoflavonifractor sp.]
MPLPRMRTAAGVLAIIKEQDPSTEVTLHYIRQLINTGKVTVTPVGTKKLVDADAVISYIANGEAAPSCDEVPVTGQIRRVPA